MEKETIIEETIYDYIYNENKHRLKLPAINYFDNRITYQQFIDKSNSIAKSLQHFGIKKGDFVTAIVPTLPESYYLLLAVSRLGAVANFVDPRYGEKAIAKKISDSNSKLVIAFDGAVKTFNRHTNQFNKQHVLDKLGNIIKDTNVENIIALPAGNSISLKSILKNDTIRAALFDKTKSQFKDYYTWKEFYKSGKEIKELDIPPHQKDIPVAVVSTGGSTGFPKSALFSNENIIEATKQCKLIGIFPEEARWYDIMPISIAYGLADGSILPFSLGNEVRLNPDPTLKSLKKPNQLQMVEDLVRFDPHTIACAPNHVLEIINSEEWKNKPHSLINFIVGGDSLNKEQLKRANEELTKIKRPKSFNKEELLGDKEDILVINTGWGTTETTAAASVARGNEKVIQGTVGQILPNEQVEAFIQNPETGEYEQLPRIKVDNQTDEYQQNGELCVSGPNVFLGYLNNPEETNKAIKKHSDGKLWVHTGDLGYVDENDYIHFIDRQKYISVGHDGFKVAPLEIENVLLKEPHIDSCKAVVIEDPEHENGTVVKVFYTLKNPEIPHDIKKIEETMNLMCELELADYKCPVSYECLEKLPLTPSGKIDVMLLKNKSSKSKGKTLIK